MQKKSGTAMLLAGWPGLLILRETQFSEREAPAVVLNVCIVEAFPV